jgi:uncharacterized protein YecT (DUF1311 family)
MHRSSLDRRSAPGSARGAARLCAAPAFAALLFALPGSSAVAAPKPGAAYDACMAKANTTADMRACQGTGLTDANARLAVIYVKALAALPADQQAKLRAAQQRWLAFRASDCSVFFGAQAGSIAPVQSGACMIDRTEKRIKNMQDLLPL